MRPARDRPGRHGRRGTAEAPGGGCCTGCSRWSWSPRWSEPRCSPADCSPAPRPRPCRTSSTPRRTPRSRLSGSRACAPARSRSGRAPSSRVWSSNRSRPPGRWWTRTPPSTSCSPAAPAPGWCPTCRGSRRTRRPRQLQAMQLQVATTTVDDLSQPAGTVERDQSGRRHVGADRQHGDAAGRQRLHDGAEPGEPAGGRRPRRTLSGLGLTPQITQRAAAGQAGRHRPRPVAERPGPAHQRGAAA